MRGVADGAAVGRRTLYYTYASGADLVDACRRRAQTIWRGRFEQRVLAASADPKERLFAVVDELDAWVGSPRFGRDQALLARPTFIAQQHEDDMREHLAEIQRFASGLAVAANASAPDEYGALVATLAAGAAAWFDRREAARAVGIAVVARLIAQTRD
jgi:AcrR family transcriptional regulator